MRFHHPRACSVEMQTVAVLPSWPEQRRLGQFYSLCIANSYHVFPAKLLRNFICSDSGLCFVSICALAWRVNATTAVLNFPYSSVRVRCFQIACTVGQRFSNFFQVGTTFISQNVLRTTFISQNVLRTTLLLGLSNSLGLP